MKEGIAGKIAKGFIGSKLTILLMVVFMVIGVYSSFFIPREEEPQIDVPMADIFVGYPGASPTEVESRVIKPLEKIISNIKGIEYVYSTSMKEQGMVIVQFYVGEDIERSFVKLYNEINKHMDQMPKGVTMPLVKTRAIDDVPMLGLTLWSENYDDYQLKQLAQELTNEIEKVNDVAITQKIGGRNREVRVVVDKDKLAASGLDFLSVTEMLKASNQQLSAGSYDKNDTEFLVTTGKFLQSAEDVKNLVVGVQQNQPIYLKQVANVLDGPEIPKNYVSFGYGQASSNVSTYQSEYPAVTISVAKRKGADAMQIADVILAKVDHLRTNLIPNDVHVEITRNYGETASQKVSELLLHLIGAIIAVTLVVMLAMGWRGGLVVFLSVPITFALTLLSYYMLDYTLNRITLFALVFVTGIVVDDSIIIAENMHRHFKMKRLPFKQAALYAINEVGNPTILATFTVIASVLPMAFVSGLMGPYMSPMPIGASIAMILSLFVALTITPYLGYIFLREKDKHDTEETFEGNETKAMQSTLIYKLYEKFERPLIENKTKRWAFLGITIALLLGSMSLFFTKSVAVKMLPFDNKNEFQVVIDMPEGTTLERTDAVTKEIAQYLATRPEVVNYQSYVGTSAPITFNGLVRHYDLRGGSNMADIQVNLTDKHDRSEQSHDIAKLFRPEIQAIAAKFNANVKLVEVPPGPPVLSTIVAEVYGPDYEKQIEIANEVQNILHNTTDVVDIDWMVEDNQTEYEFVIDKEKAMLYGVAPQQIAYTLNMALSNKAVSTLYDEDASNQVGIVFALDEKEKSSVQDIAQLQIKSQHGNLVSISDLVSVEEKNSAKSIYRKNQKRVVYVMADMAGELESPAYAILGMEEKLKEIPLPKGYKLNELYIKQPDFEDDYTVKWDGEWQITLEVFRDLGIAFLGVIIIIYMLIVGWFQNFKAPIVMMVAIPLSMVGIILGHWMMDAYFTATSFIGMIALAGIMVRNSVLLIDFVNLRLAEGVPLKQAVIEAGAVRTTPILLTAGTVVIGAFVILFDPIFQGLAISLMGGTITATVLTLLVVPLVYYLIERKNYK
ncbi:Multidrug efflux pump subunit AcrB [Tenacibaculum mesophilum]|uniref:Efflux RND transporter permease subunit n=1 Tax=Tenacibaculum mesophilum TaxID=104268 RepID=A0ABM7CFP8_9FLAO|nr:efflux RND transporter permease subunit [Tenacibaculum mesophilum]AZJ32600.1 efflux RND transporter permease subunit [Tenacibaculum mesophilum]QFS27851.1 AcrB/AcrD/AcrF family protein [Tenacibaculum mesophilum]SHG07395.1 Multidrug efflux pump subunit AcrB [Tenacibaculum mesophilum]